MLKDPILPVSNLCDLFYFQNINVGEKENLDDNSKNIAEVSQRLAQVTAERDQLRNQKDHDQDWEAQCQRYEERMVELHSVIAELSRKLDIGKENYRFQTRL